MTTILSAGALLYLIYCSASQFDTQTILSICDTSSGSLKSCGWSQLSCAQRILYCLFDSAKTSILLETSTLFGN